MTTQRPGYPVFAPQLRTFRWPRLRMSGIFHSRSIVVCAVLLVATVSIGIFSLTIGSADLGVGDVWAALTGQADAATHRVVVDWRLPRIVFAAVGGAALAVSGAVFQSITRNPLGSPDIIGFSVGSFTGALVAGLIVGNSAWGSVVGAIAGGLIAGVAVYLLAYRRGVSGLRIIVVGIAVSLFLGAVNTYLLTTLQLEAAVAAATWSVGSLADIGWQHTWPVLIAIVVILPIVLLQAPKLRLLELGDDAGRALGIRAESTRAFSLLLAVLLVAVVTAAAGPIAFVALAAPQIAARLAGRSGVRVMPAALMGAVILVASDLASRTLLSPMQMPVGVFTMCVGGAYLVWLLAAPRRKART